MTRQSVRCLCLLALLSNSTVSVIACGPFFPDDVLDQPRAILQPPMFHFQSELHRLPLPESLSNHPPGTPAYTLDLEMAEMEIIMASHPDRQAWMERYRALRRVMISAGDESDQKMRQPDSDAIVPWAKARRELDATIAPLPEDVRLYLQGAARHLDGADATGLWKQVLALPAESRRWRGTWAAWMLFRTTPHDEQGRWLAETRRLSREGSQDCLHLGIEAAYILGRPRSDFPERSQVTTAEWKRAAMLRSILGLSRATENLRHDRRLFTTWSEEFARDVIADPFLRRVQMLELIEVAADSSGWESGYSQIGGALDDLQRWLDSFEKAGICDQKEAVLLAWITYNAAKFDSARRWLALAPQDDANALALRGKLSAMRGDRRETARLFGQLSAKVPTPANGARVAWHYAQIQEASPLNTGNYSDVRLHKLLADYGIAQIARNDFAGALQTFLRTDYWRDAAYIAERLLSVEEILALSRAGKLPRLEKTHVPDAEPRRGPLRVSHLTTKYGSRWHPSDGPDPFTYLVARRLAREGFFKDACKLLPDDLATALDRYASELKRSKDMKLDHQKRANALWTASQIQRALGMELFGFETGPDHSSCGGSFDLGNVAIIRSKRYWAPEWATPENWKPDPARHSPVFPATADEQWRARHYGPRFERRFHYRYTAADLAWRAATLMPDDDEQTAVVLATAGSWLKNRDPDSADRFYKALVRRNPSVPLAHEADLRRWFPAVTGDFDLELGP